MRAALWPLSFGFSDGIPEYTDPAPEFDRLCPGERMR